MYDNNIATCVKCGKKDRMLDMPVMFDGRDVCWTCADEDMVTCTSCGMMHEAWEMFVNDVDWAILCPNCAKNETGVTFPTSQQLLPAGVCHG